MLASSSSPHQFEGYACRVGSGQCSNGSPALGLRCFEELLYRRTGRIKERQQAQIQRPSQRSGPLGLAIGRDGPSGRIPWAPNWVRRTESFAPFGARLNGSSGDPRDRTRWWSATRVAWSSHQRGRWQLRGRHDSSGAAASVGSRFEPARLVLVFTRHLRSQAAPQAAGCRAHWLARKAMCGHRPWPQLASAASSRARLTGKGIWVTAASGVPRWAVMPLSLLTELPQSVPAVGQCLRCSAFVPVPPRRSSPIMVIAF